MASPWALYIAGSCWSSGRGLTTDTKVWVSPGIRRGHAPRNAGTSRPHVAISRAVWLLWFWFWGYYRSLSLKTCTSWISWFKIEVALCLQCLADFHSTFAFHHLSIAIFTQFDKTLGTQICQTTKMKYSKVSNVQTFSFEVSKFQIYKLLDFRNSKFKLPNSIVSNSSVHRLYTFEK